MPEVGQFSDAVDSRERLPHVNDIEDPGEIPEVATLTEFATWLTARNGVLEGRSTAHGNAGDLSPLVRAPISDAWVSDAGLVGGGRDRLAG